MDVGAPAEEVAHALAVELFKRTGISSAVGIVGVGIMAYPHFGIVPVQVVVAWTAIMVAIFGARILTSRFALKALRFSAGLTQFLGLETALCAMLGLGWGAALYAFDTAQMDTAFFLRLMILAAAMSFILSSTAVYVRVFLAYTLGTGVTAMAFVLTHGYVQPQATLALSMAFYMAMIFALGISTNRRIRSATVSHIAVTKLTEELNRALASERKLRETISQSAVTDELTGALNRRGILDNLEHELTRCRRYKLPLAVLMIDIDHFKRINDTYGHACGDIALCAVLQAAQPQLRETDMLGRYGGEEFIALLPAIDRAGALIAAERLRERVAAGEVLLGGTPEKITVSIGVAFYAEKDDITGILARADKALYAAKHNGRNRVEAELQTGS